MILPYIVYENCCCITARFSSVSGVVSRRRPVCTLDTGRPISINSPLFRDPDRGRGQPSGRGRQTTSRGALWGIATATGRRYDVTVLIRRHSIITPRASAVSEQL